MVDRSHHPAILFLTRHWAAEGSELAFVIRSMAGAVSRSRHVVILTPGPAGRTDHDGAFDLVRVGEGVCGGWPVPSETVWPSKVPGNTSIVVDELDDAAQGLLDSREGDGRVFSVYSSATGGNSVPLQFVPSPATGDCINIFVPVNPLAAAHRHNGLGFTGYVLVLSDRAGNITVNPPAPTVAWLTARFPTLDIVVVENGAAAAWRGRVLRGIIGIDTRTDLWRLLAHARVTIDLAPGPIIARECIESLLYGTPIVVPADSSAAAHARAGGGLTFTDIPGLFECMEEVGDPDVLSGLSTVGRQHAESHYGDPTRSIASMAPVVSG